MSFHLGKPILVMIAVAGLSGAAILLRPGQTKRADLQVWVFHDSHRRTYDRLIPGFEQETGLSVRMDALSSRAENVRLLQNFMAGQGGSYTPDLVEIEIGSVGRYFRPPLREVGFLPLNDYLKKSGWDKRIVASRLAPWSKNGVVFGVPHDVHPVTITYRYDLFEQAGVDLSASRTWAEFQDKCIAFQDYWRKRGHPNRHAFELPEAASDYLVVMLLQRGINPIDDRGEIHLADPRVTQTVVTYAQMVAGPRKIGAESTGGTGAFARDLQDGNICAFVTADWRYADLKQTGGEELSGKLRMMPLPRFDPTDAPTSTWGGTMIGILKTCKRPDDAWRLIERLYLDERGMEARRAETKILPPVPEAWKNYGAPDPYFGGQDVEGLYMRLAEGRASDGSIEGKGIPARYVTPATGLASAALGLVQYRAVSWVKSHGTDGLEEATRGWLKAAAEDLHRRIEHGKFDEEPAGATTREGEAPAEPREAGAREDARPPRGNP